MMLAAILLVFKNKASYSEVTKCGINHHNYQQQVLEILRKCAIIT